MPGNNSVYGSATRYIPEAVWNESASNGGSGLWAGGGGASIAYTKPSWQTGPGVPADGKRDVPDVSLTAAGHDGYVIVESGGMEAIAGTSASAPSFAGLMALVNQKTGARQGLANAILYPLAVNQAAGGAAIFHDTIAGNNSVPGVTGFAATAGYDRASGLGSVDATLLVDHWTDAAKTPTASLSMSASSTALTVKVGSRCKQPLLRLRLT
jgi:pseudomonalisin